MTLSPDDLTDQEGAGIVRTLQIIAGALVGGVAMFLVIALVLRSGKGLFAADPWDVMPPNGLITLVGLLMGILLAILSFVVPKQIAANLLKGGAITNASGGSKASGESLARYGAYQTQMIIGMALLEGASLFNGVAFLLEGHIPSLVIALVLILLMLARFPTGPSIVSWVEDQRARLQEDRNAA